MIKKSDKDSIKRVIGYRYAISVQKELIDRNEYNRNGRPYSTRHIINVMNGEKHKIIEAAIYRVVKKCLKIQKERKHLLKKKRKHH